MTAHSGLIIDYLGSGTHAARPATPNIGSGVTAVYYETDTTNTFAWTGSAWVQLNGAGTGGPGSDGWIVAEAWTYVSADGPTGVFSAAADVTGKYQPGMRVKYTQSATVKYGIITAVGSFGSGVTNITIYGGTDYTLANAAISATNYSPCKAPFGFNGDPSKWTVEVSDTTIRTQSSPVSNTWYNLGTISISIPIGLWDLSYEVLLFVTKAAIVSIYSTLSTANNSASDQDLVCAAQLPSTGIVPVHREKVLGLAAKTTYFLNTKTGSGSVTDINNDNADSTLFIRARCAFL